jgi:branched-chain amino acid aminotransferase
MGPVVSQTDTSHPAYMWIDGALVPWDRAMVHASTLGWSTMSAVFEGIKAYWNPEQRELFGWQFREHYDRFAASMRLMRMETRFGVDDLASASVELLRATGCQADTQVRPLAWHASATWFGDMLGLGAWYGRW